jgi:hypothetical protein
MLVGSRLCLMLCCICACSCRPWMPPPCSISDRPYHLPHTLHPCCAAHLQLPWVAAFQLLQHGSIPLAQQGHQARHIPFLIAICCLHVHLQQGQWCMGESHAR